MIIQVCLMNKIKRQINIEAQLVTTAQEKSIE